MDCSRAWEAISAALDGELPQEERTALSEHLLNCPDCRALAEDLRALTDAMEDSERDPPPELAQSIRRAVAEESKTDRLAPDAKRRRSRWPAVAAALALCLGLGGAGLFVFGHVGADNASSAGGAGPALYQSATTAGRQGSQERGLEDGCAPQEEAADCAPQAEAAPESAEAPMAPGGSEADTGNGSAVAVPEPSSAPFAVQKPDSAKTEIVAEEALELVFQYLGGYETYPEARQRMAAENGFDAPAYYLKTEEDEQGTYEYCLDYVGLSANALYHQCRLYENVTYHTQEDFDHTAVSNWFAVSLDGSEVLSEFPPNGGDEGDWAAYSEAYHRALAD